MSKEIRRAQDCCDYKKVESFARNKGCDIRQGKGDHGVISYNGQSVVYCRREVGVGIGCKIFKWFVKMGLLGLAGVLIYAFLYHSNLL